MHNVGSTVLALLFFGAGGCLGEAVRRVWQDRVQELFEPAWFFWAIIIANGIAIASLVLLRRQARREAPLERIEHPLRLLVHGLPLTERIALLLLSSCYVIGICVGVIVA